MEINTDGLLLPVYIFLTLGFILLFVAALKDLDRMLEVKEK